MTLYVVSAGPNYYPGPFPDNCKAVFEFPEEAVAFAEQLMGDKTGDKTSYHSRSWITVVGLSVGEAPFEMVKYTNGPEGWKQR